MPRRLTVSVTYETISDASAREGDADDMGWIDPRTERRRSHRKGGKVRTERAVRLAQQGRYNWDLSEALRWIEAQCCESYEGQDDGDRLSVRAMGEYHASQYQQLQVNYGLHIEGASPGSHARIAKLLERNGVRFC